MQRGLIKLRGNCWTLYYWKPVLVDGKEVKKKFGKKLATFSPQYRRESDVRPLADLILAPINAKTAQAESTQTVETFLEHVYLEYVKQHKRLTTHRYYQVAFKLVKPHLHGMQLSGVRTSTVDQWLKAVADSKPRAHTTLRNVKSFLSGAFRYAKRIDALKDNPVRDSYVPRGLPRGETPAYTLVEVQKILAVLPEPARTACLVAALTGLRVSEIKGLRWEDVDGDVLHVRRGVVSGDVNETKTLTSRAPVPLLPLVKEALARHRRITPNGYIFQGRTGKPLRLENVVRRDILPALKKAGIPWYGWHAFRRGVGTNLRELGTDIFTIANILRHGDTSVTEQHYLKPVPTTSHGAMKKLEQAFKRSAKGRKSV